MTSKTKPWLIAHRGYPNRYPENSLAGFRAAVDAGARLLELDVQISTDGVPVVHHDQDLQRSCAVAGSLLETDLSALRSLSAHFPGRFAERYTGTPILTLEEFAGQLCAWREIQAFVEIKLQSIIHHGMRRTVDTVLHALGAALEQCILISFHTDCLVYARARSGIPIGWITKKWDEMDQRQALALQPEFQFAHADIVRYATHAIRHHSNRWAVFVVNDPLQAAHYRSLGVDLVETDAIGEMLSSDQSAHTATNPMS